MRDVQQSRSRFRRTVFALLITVTSIAACSRETDQDPIPVDDPGSSSTVDPSGQDTTGGTVGGSGDLPDGTHGDGSTGDTSDGADGEGTDGGAGDGTDRGPAPGGEHRPNPGAPEGPEDPVN